MRNGLTIKKTIHFSRQHKGRKNIKQGEPPPSVESTGNVPRISRLMALAIRFEKLVHDKEIIDYADLARLGHVSRARMTQIMNLLLLAPDIQEDILFLPEVQKGRDPICERQIRSIAVVIDWRKQRRMWKKFNGKPLT